MSPLNESRSMRAVSRFEERPDGFLYAGRMMRPAPAGLFLFMPGFKVRNYEIRERTVRVSFVPIYYGFKFAVSGVFKNLITDFFE